MLKLDEQSTDVLMNTKVHVLYYIYLLEEVGIKFNKDILSQELINNLCMCVSELECDEHDYISFTLNESTRIKMT